MDTKAADEGEVVIYTIMVYSLTVFNITLHRSRMTTCTDSENNAVQYDYAIVPTAIKLPLFGQDVRTSGFHCTLSLTVKTSHDFGNYEIGVSNAIGQTTTHMEIVPKGDY